MRVTRATVAASAEAKQAPDEFKAALSEFVSTERSSSEKASSAPQTMPQKRGRNTATDDYSPGPSKLQRKSSKYAPPSQYAHLSELQDILEDNLIAVFVGFNPGIQTATQGHAYAHPSNLFWKLVHSSGLTDRRWKPAEDGNLPTIGLGNTNLVARPTKDTAQLSKSEMADAVPALEEKIRRYKPEAVCIVGKSIWEAVWRHRHGRNPKPAEFKYGWQDREENLGKPRGFMLQKSDEWKGARVFVTTSTSGLSASLSLAQKEEIWLPFGTWVKQRRTERAGEKSTIEEPSGQ